MCCSAKISTLLFSILGIVFGLFIAGISSIIDTNGIFVGTFILALGFFGFYAVLNKKYSWIRIYAYIHIIILLCLIGLIALTFIYHHKLALELRNLSAEITKNVEFVELNFSELAEYEFKFLVTTLIITSFLNSCTILVAFSAARKMEETQIELFTAGLVLRNLHNRPLSSSSEFQLSNIGDISQKTSYHESHSGIASNIYPDSSTISKF